MKSGIKKLIKNTLKRIPPVKNLLVRFHYLRNEQVKLLNEVNAAKMEILNIRREIDYKYYKSLHPDNYAGELKDWYKLHTGKTLDLENPQTLNEKIQWLKLFDTTPLKTRLTDKYLVREWVREQIGEKYLIPLLGVWDNFDEIDFDALPEKFVLKANHGCHWNIVVKNKKEFNKDDAKEKMNKWLNTNYAFIYGLELQYKEIKPRIIAEKYLENYHGDIYDYRIWCLNGHPVYIAVDIERKIAQKKELLRLGVEPATFQQSPECRAY